MALQYPPGDALTARGRQALSTAITFGGGLAAAALLLIVGARLGGLGGAVAGFVAGQAALAGAALARRAAITAMTRPRRAPEPGALLCGVALIAAIAEFGQVWFYPAREAGAELPGPSAAPSACRSGSPPAPCILWHLLRRGPRRLVQRAGAVRAVRGLGRRRRRSFWSIDRSAGIRTLAFWLLAAGIAVAAACEVDPRTLARELGLDLPGVVVASLAVALFDPRSAHDRLR